MKIVTYDLDAPGRDYKKLLDEIRKMPSVRITESCWLINYSGSSMELINRLANLIDPNDRLFVSELKTIETAWFNLMPNDDQVRSFLSTSIGL